MMIEEEEFCDYQGAKKNMNLEKLYRTDETAVFEIVDLQLITRPVTEVSVVFFHSRRNVNLFLLVRLASTTQHCMTHLCQ